MRSFLRHILYKRFLDYPPAPLERSCLHAGEQAVVLAVADTFFPSGGPIPLSGSEAGSLEYFGTYLERTEGAQHVLIRLLLVFTEVSPWVFGPRHRRFTRLAHEDRKRFLDGAFRSPLYFRRISFLSLRALMTMAYLANDEVAQAMRMTADMDPFDLGEEIYEQPVHLGSLQEVVA